MSLTTFRIGEAFRPVPQFRSYLYASLILAVVVFVLPWLAPIVIFSRLPVALAFAVPVLAIVVFIAYWIPLYHESIVYRLTVTEVTWRRGVWFRQTGIVPYNRITNVDIVQGPLMRFFSFSAVRVQTAGYSAQAQAEIVLNGIADPKDLQETIMNFVRTTGPVAATGGEPAEGPAADAVVEELRAIRRLLESRQER
ncbi:MULTISPECIES: PH domain-containing protein [Methanoculleus]|uniref:Membrane-flanked domain n=2 Tax=Methanoculleus TaxID=45989 RepID=A3CWW6_METMJ|nr:MULTISPECIES: PH domain-containing protein [Methanoculleus]ABN57866.1 membrane-flanked domain [Methanoculleus marisnigri JR1]MCC7556722.1 PH domain-containing protein [Methanoculleus marisnigri]UYU19252.1 PH domain-containing protein [Methanoculleus submarinus]